MDKQIKKNDSIMIEKYKVNIYLQSERVDEEEEEQKYIQQELLRTVKD